MSQPLSYSLIRLHTHIPLQSILKKCFGRASGASDEMESQRPHDENNFVPFFALFFLSSLLERAAAREARHGMEPWPELEEMDV